jgi:hypothetical protein
MNNPEIGKKAIPLDISKVTPGAEFTIAALSQVQLGPLGAISIPPGEVIVVNQVSENCFAINMSNGIRAVIPNHAIGQIKIESSD